MLTLDHMSYSSWNSYKNCPRQFYLGKVRKAWSEGAWFFLTGTLVHEAVEAHLRGEPYELRENFYRLVADQMKTAPDVDKWSHGTYLERPAVKENALLLAEHCVTEAYRWLDEEFEEIVLIEADISGFLPGCEVEIKGFVDILAEHKKHGWVIADWKSSASKPSETFQLKTYRALLLQQGVSRYTKGLWAMLRPGASKARPVDLTDVDPAEVGAEYQRVYEKIKAGIFPTEAGRGCKYCVQRPNCALKSDDKQRSRFYDDVGSKYLPF